MADPRSPFSGLPTSWEDLSLLPKWRTFSDPGRCATGHAVREGDRLMWSVSPGEWTVAGPPPDGMELVDLTHVRAMLRLPASEARQVLIALCALDLDDRMFPAGAARRTDLAGVVTEIVREGDSYVLAVSRSYARYFHTALLEVSPRR